MANLPETATFDAAIFQLETTTPALGGPTGPMNDQAKGLANRTQWLKAQVEGKVAKSGDTMTGDLTISRTATAAVLTLEASDPRQRRVDFKTGGASRWSLTASNAAGEPLVLTAYDDTGTLIGNAYTVDRLTRSIAFQGAVNANGGDDSTPALSASSGAGASIRRGLVLARSVAGNVGHSIEWVMGQSPNNLPRVSITGTRSTNTGILTIATANSSAVMVDRLTIADAGSTFSHPVNAAEGVNLTQNKPLNLGGASFIVKDATGHVVHVNDANFRSWWSATDGAWRWEGGTAYSTALMRLDGAGNLYVGANLTAPLGVRYADSGEYGHAFRFAHAATAGAGYRPYFSVNGTPQGHLVMSSNTAGISGVWDGTGPYLEYLLVDGAVFGARAFTSDARLKQNIAAVNEPFLPKIRAIQPKAFDWRPEFTGGRALHNPLGLVAQDVQASIPSAVQAMGEGDQATLHIDPLALIAALIGAVTELAIANEAQSQAITALQQRLGATADNLPRLVIVDRLIARGSIHAALAALDSNPVAKARWDAAASIARDDPDVIGLLMAIGEEPEVILAPLEEPTPAPDPA